HDGVPFSVRREPPVRGLSRSDGCEYPESTMCARLAGARQIPTGRARTHAGFNRTGAGHKGNCGGWLLHLASPLNAQDQSIAWLGVPQTWSTGLPRVNFPLIKLFDEPHEKRLAGASKRSGDGAQGPLDYWALQFRWQLAAERL